MIEGLLAGLLLGLSAGVAPGPLSALVIAETLRHGVTAGIKVALSPLLTDLPIVVGSIILMSTLREFDLILGVVSLAGAGFVAYLGVESCRSSGLDMSTEEIKPHSLRRGVITNLLSPHPYLFWLTVGAPTTIQAFKVSGLMGSAAFIIGFYLLLLGAKICLALVSGRSRKLLKGRAYLITMRILGVLLLGFSLLLLRDGVLFLIS